MEKRHRRGLSKQVGNGPLRASTPDSIKHTLTDSYGGMPLTKTERLLRELVALPSVNPAFLPPDDPRAGERNVAEFLGATAAQAGLEVSFQPVFRGRSNLLARLVPRRNMRQRILLAPHLDTV